MVGVSVVLRLVKLTECGGHPEVGPASNWMVGSAMAVTETLNVSKHPVSPGTLAVRLTSYVPGSA